MKTAFLMDGGVFGSGPEPSRRRTEAAGLAAGHAVGYRAGREVRA